ncbi:MAG: TIGR03905 family TSCPD domain-containing protein [Anaerovoracaceae bacterium]
MEYTFRPRGVCPSDLTFEVENGKLKNVHFSGGCNGNLKGIAQLVEGMPLEQVRDKLQGIRCGHKATSCPDQLAQAVSQILEANE